MHAVDLGVVSVVPSPYQRDLFGALAARPDVRLRVYYLERHAPDSPWPEEPLRPFETVLPGFWFAVAGARFHVVSRPPPLGAHHALVLNSLTSSLAQTALRFRRKGQRLLFWAEALREQGTGVRARVQRLLSDPLRRVDAIVAIGSRAEAAYRKRFPGVPCFNVPYHCDLQPFFRAPRHRVLPGEEVTFLFCGQLIARKGVDILLEAFDRLTAAGRRARLRLAGRRADLDAMLAAVSAGTRERIRYDGFFDPKDLPQLFAEAHVFILPSRYDGWGVVVNQALGAGLPVICSDAVGAGVDLVTPGFNGVRFPAGDAAALAAAMASFLDEPTLVERYGNASRERAAAWTPDQGADKWVETLQRLGLRS